MDETNNDPFETSYNPFQHPLIWCLQDYLTHGQQKGSTAAQTSGNLQDVFVKAQDLQAAAQVSRTCSDCSGAAQGN